MKVIELLNPWWTEKKVKNTLAKPYKRKAFFELEKIGKKRQISVLVGLRRVGKTVLLFQYIQKLLEKGVEPRHIIYFSFDQKVEDLKDVLKEYRDITNINWEKEHIYVFLDEIQKLDNWSSQLKLFYDNFPNIKFFVSGSASIQLEQNAMADLVGRHFTIKVTPLSLIEFFELKTGKKVDAKNVWRKELEKNVEEFIKKPFPELVDFEDDMQVMEYLKESVIEKVIKADLPDTFKDVRKDLLSALLRQFYQNPGTYLNFDSLAKDYNTGKEVVIKHIRYLEFSYLIRIVKNYRPSVGISSRKLRRVYPYHWSLAFGLYPEIEKGKLVETIVASTLNAEYYWRKGIHEVDFLINNVPVEVKSKKEVSFSDAKELNYFIKRFKAKKAFVVYTGETQKQISLGIKAVPLLDVLLNQKL